MKNRPWLSIPEDERVYLDVSYKNRGFAKACYCKFDPEVKLWFTSVHNWDLEFLIDVYGIHPRTSKKVLDLLEE